MIHCKHKLIGFQFFAEGGDGGTGGAPATGVSESDAGIQALRELGATDADLAGMSDKDLMEIAAVANAGNKPNQTQEAPEAPKEGTKPRQTLKELLKADPQLNEEMQSMMQKRLAKQKDAQAALDALTPALELIARDYGLDVANLDHQALADAVTGDNRYFEDYALEHGVTIEKAREQDSNERNQARQQRNAYDQAQYEHFNLLQEQSEQCRQTYPDFDFNAECQNPSFMWLTALDNPARVPVQKAYEMIHIDEIIEARQAQATDTARRQTANAIRSGMSRPVENGRSGQAPSTQNVNLNSMSGDQWDSLEARIDAALREGKYVTIEDLLG